MTVAQTSLDAYHAIETGLTTRQREVMLFIHGRYTNCMFTRKELAAGLQWPINRVTGRVCELVALGFLEDTGNRIVEDGHGAALLRLAK